MTIAEPPNLLIYWTHARPTQASKGLVVPDQAVRGWEVLSGGGYIYWVRSPGNLRDRSARDQNCLYLAWQPRTAMPASILTVGAVPSEFRAEIRQWIDEVVGPESRDWMQALDSKSPTWLDSVNKVNWTWRRVPTSERPATRGISADQSLR